MQQCIDRDFVAVHDVEHAVRQSGFLQQFCEIQACRWIALGRLEDEGVATGDGDREHPHRHHDREIERGDAGADA